MGAPAPQPDGTPAWSAPDHQGAALSEALDLAVETLSQARAGAVSLALIALPELPDAPLSRPEDAAILRAIAPLYLALEIEQTGLLRAGSTLAGLYASGALRLARGPSAENLMAFHRGYENRLPSDDRHASYLRLFGSAPVGAAPYATPGAVNTGFEEAMLALSEAMHRYANTSPLQLEPVSATNAIRSAARRLASDLVMRGGGATAFIAEETMKQLRDVIAILSAGDVKAALGARTIWQAVAAVEALQAGRPPGLMVPSPSAQRHLERGRAGVAVVGWLADRASDLFGIGQLRLDRGDPILSQGTAWLEATLSLLTAQEAALGY
ncbi:MAG: hypothetical protein AAGI10_08715 [Pseudomonadota bacterium]